MSAPGSRFLEVAPERVVGWVERYVAARPDGVTCHATQHGLVLLGEDGSRAQLDLLLVTGRWPSSDSSRSGAQVETMGPVDKSSPVAAAQVLALVAGIPSPLLVVLARRGGWAVGVVHDGAVLAGKVGRRYVQGQTAAGGWSQQRYARRRSGQSAKLADDASSAVVRVLGQAPGVEPLAVVIGGDRALAASVLEGGPADALERLGPLEVGEPRRVDLDAAAKRVRSLRITVHDAPHA